MQQQKQQTFLQFILMMIKGFIKGLPKMIARNLVKTIIIGVGVLVLHTYLLVDINEGFWYDASNKLSPLLNVKETNTGALTLWTIGSMIVVQLWRKCRTNGFVKTIGEIISAPAWFAQCLRKSGDKKLIALNSGIAFALVASIFIKTKTSLFVFVLMTLLSFSARLQSMIVYSFRLLIADFNRVIIKKPSPIPTVSISALMLAGVSGGLVLALFIPSSLFIRGILAAVLVALAIFQAKGKISAPMAANIFVFMVIKLVFMKYNIAFADDGGLSEAGGTWTSWLGSTGAGTAVAMGVGPAVGAVGGGLLGTFLGEIEFDVDYDFDFDDDLPTDPDDPIPPEEEFNLEDHRDQIEDAFEDLGDDLSDEELDDLLDDLDVDDMDDLEDFFDDLNDIEDQMKETEKDFEKIIDAMNQDYEDSINKVKDALDDLSKGEDKESLLDWGRFGIDSLLNTVGSGLIQNELNKLDKFDECFKALHELYNSTFENTGAGDLFKNSIFDDLAKSKTIRNWSKGLDKFAQYGAGALEMYDWMKKGDDILSAGAKGFGNAKIMYEIGSRNPALGIMELVNFAAFGGSKASDCISPTKNITGPTSALFDYLTKDGKVFDKRLENGDYGQNVKNFIAAKDIAKDAAKDWDGFKKDWSDFVTIKDHLSEGGNENFRNMYKTSDELWKVPKDTMAYSPRRLFCWMGNKATKTVIAAGEGTGRLASMLGDLSTKWF